MAAAVGPAGPVRAPAGERRAARAGLASLGKKLAGIAPQRDAPPFAQQSFQDWWRSLGRPVPRPGDPHTVVLWPGTFTNHFDPHIARAAATVLERAGFTVVVPAEPVCCGLTWISTGQLGTARRTLAATVDRDRHARRRPGALVHRGVPRCSAVFRGVPRCSAVFRADAAELCPDDEDVQRLRERFATLAEALRDHAPRPWRPEPLGRSAIVQTHRHQHAIMKFDADTEVMARAGIDARRLDSRCCRAGRQLRFRGRALRGVHGVRGAGAAARGPRRRPRHPGARGRLQLPHPDRAGRHRPACDTPCRGPSRSITPG